MGNKKILPITPNILMGSLKEHQVSFKLFRHKPVISVSDSKKYSELILPDKFK